MSLTVEERKMREEIDLYAQGCDAWEVYAQGCDAQVGGGEVYEEEWGGILWGGGIVVRGRVVILAKQIFRLRHII